MGDPFEEAGPPSLPNPALREDSIRQATNFLNDPRVKGSDTSKALTFLRGKGITEDELREAYRRCEVPFPSTAPAPFVPPPFPYSAPPFPPYAGPVVPFQPPPPQARTSWISLFWGITAAAGVYAALRELLKRYVVPMYFPEAARIAEERRRRDELTIQSQETQIAELRAQIQELIETAKMTNQKVEDLSASMSSSLAQRRREISQNSELRDAIRQLSHTVTASTGTDPSIAPKHTQTAVTSSTAYRAFMDGKQAQKHGNLAYSHVNSFNGSLMPHVEESHSRQVLTPLPVNEATDSYPSGKKSSNKADNKLSASIHVSQHSGGGANENEDEFMAIAPAEVEESWGAKLDQKQEASQPPAPDMLEEKPSNGNDGNAPESSMEVEGVADSTASAPQDVEGRNAETFDFRDATTSAARQLFQDDLMNEAKLVLGSASASKDRSRPLSMPQMDIPLSDGEN